MDLCDVVTEKFTAARDAFNSTQTDRMVSWYCLRPFILLLHFACLAFTHLKSYFSFLSLWHCLGVCHVMFFPGEIFLIPHFMMEDQSRRMNRYDYNILRQEFEIIESTRGKKNKSKGSSKLSGPTIYTQLPLISIAEPSNCSARRGLQNSVNPLHTKKHNEIINGRKFSYGPPRNQRWSSGVNVHQDPLLVGNTSSHEKAASSNSAFPDSKC